MESQDLKSAGSALQKSESADKRDEAGIGSRIDVMTGQQELRRSYVWIHQISGENIANVRSEGHNNLVENIQTTDRPNIVDPMKSASGNTAQITQKGYRNRLGSDETRWINPRIITEQICDSKLVVSHAGDFNRADFMQDGSIADAYPYGILNVIASQEHSRALILQNGKFNSAYAEQYSGSAEISQEGKGNLITLHQL